MKTIVKFFVGPFDANYTDCPHKSRGILFANVGIIVGHFQYENECVCWKLNWINCVTDSLDEIAFDIVMNQPKKPQFVANIDKMCGRKSICCLFSGDNSKWNKQFCQKNIVSPFRWISFKNSEFSICCFCETFEFDTVTVLENRRIQCLHPMHWFNNHGQISYFIWVLMIVYR